MELRTAEQKSCGVGLRVVRLCLCEVHSGFPKAWQRLACDKPAAPHQHIESANAFTGFRSPSLRTAQSSAVRRGQTWEKEGGWKAEAKTGRKRMRGGSRSGVKCKEDSNERQLSCTSARPGAPVSGRTCKVCRSRPDNTPTFLHKDQHTRTHTHWEFRDKKKKKKGCCSTIRKALPVWQHASQAVIGCFAYARKKLGWWRKTHRVGGWSEKNHWDMNRPEVRILFSKIWCRVNAGSQPSKKLHKGNQKNQENTRAGLESAVIT